MTDSAYEDFGIVVEFEETRGFALGEDGEVRQVFGPPAPPSEPRRQKTCPGCGGHRLAQHCVGYIDGMDCNRCWCDCGWQGRVFMTDGTPEVDWPAWALRDREPAAVYETSRGRLAIYRGQP